MIQRFKLVRFYVKLGFIAKNIRSTVKKKKYLDHIDLEEGKLK